MRRTIYAFMLLVFFASAIAHADNLNWQEPSNMKDAELLQIYSNYNKLATSTKYLPSMEMLARLDSSSVAILFDSSLEDLLANPVEYEEFQLLLSNTASKPVDMHIYFRDSFGKVVAARKWIASNLHEPKVEPSAPKPLAPQYSGSLSGKVIIVSPGHGYYYDSGRGAWVTQRGDTFGLIEDFSNAEICDWYLIPYLEHAGATVYSVRERDMQPDEIIADNDDSSVYSDEGGWNTSSYTGYANGTYRTHETSSTATATARWTANVPSSGRYAVWVFYRAGTNRVSDAHFRILHSDGTTDYRIDQKQNNLRWVYIGTYRFDAGVSGQGVELLNDSSESGYVIADAVRFGAGVGTTTFGGPPSGKPRWKECSKAWTKYVGAPSSVYDRNDVTCRPGYAEWQGGDLYISVHSNAYTGDARGTLTLSALYGRTDGSDEFRDILHEQVVRIIRANWDANWTSRTPRHQDLGELRELQTMPGALIETAFHDNDTDNWYLQNAYWRHDVARGIYIGILRYLKGSSATVLPLPIRSLAVSYDGGNSLLIQWSPRPDPLEPSANADYWKIYISKHPDGFGLGDITSNQPQKQLDVSMFDDGQIYFVRVSAVNSGGESFLSEPVAFRIFKGMAAPILVVNGFDRNDRAVKERDNTHDFVKIHGAAIAAAGNYSFVSATNEAVVDGLVSLDEFQMVDWILGEESTLDETFNADERNLVSSYLDAGGSFFVSGSEIGWDLYEKGTAAEQQFYTGYFHNQYVSDDANTYSASGAGLLAGLNLSFDDGSHGTYDVDYPDVISADSSATCIATYAGGDCAAVSYSGSYKVVFFAFPFETIVDSNSRISMMQRLLSEFFGVSEYSGADGDMDEPDADPDLDLFDEEDVVDFVDEPDSIEQDEESLPVDGDEELADIDPELAEESMLDGDLDAMNDSAVEEALDGTSDVAEDTLVDLQDDSDWDRPSCYGVDIEMLQCDEGYRLDPDTCRCIRIDEGSSDSGCAASGASLWALVLLVALGRRFRKD